jgi:transposase
MRFGLWGQVRRRWGRKGIKIIQNVQIEFAWEYLVLAVNVMTAELTWAWAARMNQAQLLPIFRRWSPEAVIWDGASAHRAKAMGQLGFVRIALPAYSPELNPAERVFEEIRREIEGEVYPSLRAKQLAIEQLLRQVRADQARLRQLIGWDWIVAAHDQLPLSDTRIT